MLTKPLLVVLLAFVVISAANDRETRGIGDIITGVVGKVKDAFTSPKTALNSLLGTVESCTVSKDKGWFQRDLGDFRIGENSPYCDSNCTRSAVCCAPQKPAEITVHFYHFDQRNKSTPLNLTTDPQTAAKLVQQNKQLVWFIHGFKDNIFKNPVFNQTKDAFLKRGVDVVMVDWSGGNLAYFQSLANIRIVAALTAKMIQDLDVLDSSTCIGFSLGAHVCGEVGSWLKRRHMTLPRCIGIDPAGPAFDGCSDLIRLDKSDCGIVTAIHTSQFEGIGSLIDNEGLGTKGKVGHCDFWANDGKDQPKCSSSIFSKSCSHARGMDYFLSEVKKVCHFEGHEAECGAGENCQRYKRASLLSGRKEEAVPEAFQPIGGWRRAGDHMDKSGKRLQTKMRIPPDDSCTSDYDMDYQFDTMAKEPYC